MCWIYFTDPSEKEPPANFLFLFKSFDARDTTESLLVLKDLSNF